MLVALASALLVAAPSASPASAADPVCTISAKLVNSCRPWVGAESANYGQSTFRARMLEHETRLGRQLDIVHAYLGAGATALTPDMVTMAKRPGTIGLYNWRVSLNWAAGGGDNATVNGQIDQMAASIKALGTTKIMLTVFHEPESAVSSGGSPSCPTLKLTGTGGTTADYVNMWHNVRERFDALGVTNVVWVMNYVGYVSSFCMARDLWPGNDYVDWVMWDPYPAVGTWAAVVGSFYNYLTANSDADHDFLSKPWGLAEFGYIGTNQAAAYAMYDDAARAIHDNTFPKLKAYAVWDNWTSSSHDDRVGYTQGHVLDPVEQQHYNALANDPALIGTAVPEPTDQAPPTVVRLTPEDGAAVSGTVEVTGTASDDVGLESVQLLVDDSPAGSATPDGDGHVTIAWNSGSVANGTHSLRLWARDTSGNTALSDPAGVTVYNADVEAPSVPQNPAASWSRGVGVTLTWSASTDNLAVTGYRIYRDGDPFTTLGSTDTEYVDDDVANLSTHTYAVAALDAAGNESDPSGSRQVTAGDDTAPTIPAAGADLTAPHEATVSWVESTDNHDVAGYRVYRDGSPVADVAGTVTTWVDDGLDDVTSYTYRVSAYDASGNESDRSDPAVVTTTDSTAPGVPANLRAVSAPASVSLTWNASTDNVAVTNYVVYRDGLPVMTLGGTTTSWTDSALVGSTLHRYQVTARDATGNESAKSNEVARTVADTTAPTAPTRLAGSLSGLTVRLTWTASTDAVGVTSYTVYRGGVAIGTSTMPAYTDATPPLGKASSYTVRARDAAGNTSAASSAVSVTVPTDKTAPTTPGSVRLTVGTTGTRQITVAWNASTDNVGVTGYYLYRANAKYKLLGKVTSYVDTGLRAGTKYTYKVYALDAAGNWSGASASVSGTAR